MLNQILIDLLYLISLFIFLFLIMFIFSPIFWKLLKSLIVFLTFLILPVGINLLVTSRYFSELIFKSWLKIVSFYFYSNSNNYDLLNLHELIDLIYIGI